jgi:hypothetical protein
MEDNGKKPTRKSHLANLARARREKHGHVAATQPINPDPDPAFVPSDAEDDPVDAEEEEHNRAQNKLRSTEQQSTFMASWLGRAAPAAAAMAEAADVRLATEVAATALQCALATIAEEGEARQRAEKASATKKARKKAPKTPVSARSQRISQARWICPFPLYSFSVGGLASHASSWLSIGRALMEQRPFRASRISAAPSGTAIHIIAGPGQKRHAWHSERARGGWSIIGSICFSLHRSIDLHELIISMNSFLFFLNVHTF